MLRSKISLLVLALALGAVSVSAAPASDPAPIHAFRTFTRGSGVTGLPASTVLALSTDHQGTIWIATFDGLARVERGVVERLAPRPNAPVSGPMFDVIARRAGCVYASGAKGLYAFDGTTWTLTPTPQDLISIAEDGGSRIIGLDRRSHTWVKAPGADWVEIPGTEHLELRRVTPLPNGDVLAAGAAGVFRISNGALAGAYGDRAPQGLTTTVVASDERVWVGSESGRVYARAGDGEWEGFDIPGWDGGRIRALREDRRHRIWVGGDEGRAAFGTASTPFEVWRPENGLKASTITAITGDLTGSVWFGYNGAGLQQWLGEAWTHRTFWRTPSDVDAAITFSVRPTEDHGFIAAVFSHGVWRWDGHTLATYGREQGITEDVRFALEPTPGVIWVGARVGIFEGRAGGRFRQTLRLDSGFVTGFFKSPAGEWWATTTADGVFVRRGDRWEPLTALNDQLAKLGDNIRDLLWQSSGRLWIATGRRLVALPDGPASAATAIELPEGLSSPNALAEHDGELWVAASGGIGVVTFTGASPSWRVITPADGLPGNTIYSLAFAGDGSLWAGGSSGVGHFTGHAWELFDSSNALISEECNTFGLLVEPSGRVLVGTMAGLAVFDPRSLAPVPVQKLQVFWRTEFAPAQPAGESLIRIGPTDRRLTLEWSAPWPRPVPVVFRTRLVGLSDAWSDEQASPVLRVENLAAGTYQAQVQARFDRVGAVWSDPISATVVVAPRVWETWWARLGLVGVAGLVVIGLIRWRTARLATRARELEAAVAEALSSAKVLRGLLPICAHCKKVRDDGGYWTRIEDYISRHSEADFSHGFCPDCVEKHYSDAGLKDID